MKGLVKKSVFMCLTPLLIWASVEHKDEFINIYLSNISENMDEKTQILEHILKNPHGTYLDIGTGGDAIAIMAQKLNPAIRTHLIAADIDPLVLESIKKRRSDVECFLNSKEGPKVDLMTMSAVDMKDVKDSSLAGISASALTHEVFSYVPKKSSIDQFTSEVCRTLEKDGVFIYRDPKWVDDPEKMCNMIIKSELAKYYTTLFLTKFLDRDFSLIRDHVGECCKPKMHKASMIHISAFLKGSSKLQRFTFADFSNIATSKIDYSKNISIEAPLGLIAEIQRHYLMYLKDYFAPGFVDLRFFKQELNVNNLAEDERKVLLEFIKRKNLPIQDKIITKQMLPDYLKELDTLRKLFDEGFKLNTSKNPELQEAVSHIPQGHINKNLFFFDEKKTIFIDMKMLGLLFQGKNQGIFSLLSKHDQTPWDILEHLKLEGEEHYFYKTRDELITYFGQYSKFYLHGTHKDGYILAPISKEGVKEVSRDYYRSIINRDFLTLDSCGLLQDPVTEKNIIHFKLQSKDKAFEVYNDLIKNDPESYPKLQKWLYNEQRRDP